MISFGSDPEFMLIDKRGKYKSAIGIVPGSRDEKHKIGKHDFYFDNVLAECAINPGYSKEEVIENFRNCFQLYAKLVSPYKLVLKAAQKYSKEELQHPAAIEIGCKREACAYLLDWIEPDEDMFLRTNWRSAGGHVHIGNETLKESFNRIRTTRMLDLFLGVPSIYLDCDKSTKKRKELYGQAGRFREPSHGLEYRSLGNFWLCSPDLVRLVYDLVEFTVNFVNNDEDKDFWFIDIEKLNDDDFWNEGGNPVECHKCIGYNENNLRAAIDEMNKRKAKAFMTIIEKLLPKRCLKAISEAEVNLGNFYKEWRL